MDNTLAISGFVTYNTYYDEEKTQVRFKYTCSLDNVRNGPFIEYWMNGKIR